jgi:RNA polymerase sigma factor (sigma-70 family)
MVIEGSTTPGSHLATLFEVGAVGRLPDAELLRLIVVGRGDSRFESAFAAIVERHGPMVLGVCRRVLRDEHAAADAFQATFLILARKAGSVRVADSLGRWLYGVSVRVARRARSIRKKERDRVQHLDGIDPIDGTDFLEPHLRDERRAVIDEEIIRLPDRYRSAVVLCYMEGLTQEEAARQLRCPVGTIQSRLHRARERLRPRLARLGLAPAVAGLSTLVATTSRADIPPRLLARTAVAASRLAAGGPLAGTVPKAVAALVKPSIRSTMMIATCGTGLIALGIAALSYGMVPSPQDADEPAKTVRQKAAPADPKDLILFGVTDYDLATVTTVRLPLDGRVDKVLVDLGATVHKGDPLLEVSCAALATAKNDYEVAAAQLAHDKKVVYFIRAGLKDDRATTKTAREAENDEALSRTKVKVARDRLLFHGLTEAEIAEIRKQDGVQKARMTLLARADGVLVKRDVVPGNSYDSRDTLLTIVPLDHLWVRGSVDEKDAEKLEIGQPLKVIFPFSSTNREIAGKLEFIDRTIDPGTRKARFRTTIPNPEGRYKAGAYVKVEVQVTSESRRAKGKETPGPSPRAKGDESKANGD